MFREEEKNREKRAKKEIKKKIGNDFQKNKKK
jgi:hypothetical protein